MSSDTSIHIKHPDGYSTWIEVGNMTSNIRAMMIAACGVSLPWFDGLTCEKALPILRHAWYEMKRHPTKFKRVEADNGWGTYDQFVSFLTRYYVLVRLHPTGRIEVSW